MKSKIVLAIVLFLSSSVAYSELDNSMFEKLYASMVDQWKVDVVKAFNEAEKELLDIDVPIVPIGPNEDPAKCPCKGSGVIVHGDGHETPCPFHSKEFGSLNTKGFVCECDSKCACEVCQCEKMEIK